MIYLFGSRAKGLCRPDSDIDVFIETDKEAEALRPYLVAHGGVVDAFWEGPEWSAAVDDDERMLLLDDPTSPIPIALEDVMALIPRIVHNHNHKED